MKKLLKKLGRITVALEQKDERDVRQSLLLVDAGFILPNNFCLILKGVKNKFGNARISVLTFQDKKGLLADNFPDVEVLLFDGKAGVMKGLGSAIQLWKALRRNFDFIVLSSLDIMAVVPSLCFGRARVFLYNRWLEFYHLRIKNFSDIIKRRDSADKNRRKKNKDIKDFFKSLGRSLVILEDGLGEKIKSRILVVDNGYTAIDQVLEPVRKTWELFVEPQVTVLTFAKRRHYFMNEFAQAKVTAIADAAKRPALALAWQMCRIYRQRFNCIILTELEILPVLVALELNAKKVLLYNRWHQWWSLKFKNFKEYLKDALGWIAAILLTPYLLAVSGLILLRTFIRARFINVKIFSEG